MSPDRYLTELASSLDRLSILARQSEEVLARRVPACPGWTLEDLFGHLGSIERWAAEIVLAGEFIEEPAPPTTGAVTWFLEGVDAFLGTMAALDPERPCWNFGPPPRKAGFWRRRQAHEHAVHLIDACQASELAVPSFAADFMLDGIDEILTMFTPRQLRLERMPQLEGSVTFQVPGAHSWKLGQGAPEASITSPLRGMYLGLWGRSNLSETAIIEGDKALALRVLQGPLTP
ncbi:maleylpyruvate isomerase family mycothiol-dependent enzyme [Arthrobacter sp. B2a2-09]|uniref:maleylpyruvate isomerase family mycothiol-dependent enzyme n=1 Tax=Arthrobacter sp. B2a2-09 TaxID=2952822 RepID=UPI0022CD636C|nr:maleylpyruvate isomerase family mycothiol-dependent enzyme [Arthrobacter sp. B2a2-09]MCZ9880285.1 maleylpyruvate isomerase family mycothiol-dependent enzyme [Arthrobacter sp. B2a2-09]